MVKFGRNQVVFWGDRNLLHLAFYYSTIQRLGEEAAGVSFELCVAIDYGHTY